MKHHFDRAGLVLAMVISCFAMAGCLESSSDGEDSAGADPGAVAVNGAPTISGDPPPAINVGDTYSFVPTSSDPDGDSLTFNVVNKPDWMRFDRATGLLSGYADVGSEGRYEGITITASDGEKTASLGPFAIEITQIALGSATLSWTPPLENTDGSQLVDLMAYKIYYGTSLGFYTRSIRLNNTGLSMYVIENLVPNTYYFVATAINSAGVESSYSNVMTMVVTPL